MTEPLLGAQRPRECWVPPAVSTAQGDDAVELAASAGLILDDWQAWVLKHSLGILPGGQWSAFEVGLLVPRQSGKNTILEARELAGLYLLDESLLIHTAHEFKTSEEHFLRMQSLIEGHPDLDRLVRKVTTSHGSEGIELFPTPTIIYGSDAGAVRRGLASRRLRFLARSRSSARGFTADLLVYDEAMILSNETVGSSMPTMAAVPNPQLWYTASEGRHDAYHLARVRRRGLARNDPALMWAEWSAELCHEFCPKKCTEHDDPASPVTWAKANPGLGIRISLDYLARAHASMDPDVFAASHLAFTDWPAEADGWSVISEGAWDACADPGSPKASRPFALAADATPNQSAASIAIAGRRPDGKIVGEIPQGDHRPGTSWVVARLAELAERLRPCAITIDPHGPAASLIDQAEAAGLEIVKPTAGEIGQAFGLFYVGVADRTFVHLGADLAPELRAAVAGAAKRDMGDGAHAWARRSTAIDISPLVAVTLAMWAHGKHAPRAYNLLDSVR